MRKSICTLVVFCLGVSVFSQSDISFLQPPVSNAQVLTAYLPDYAVTKTSASNLAAVDRVIYFALSPGANSRLANIPRSHINQLRTWKTHFGFELYLGIYDHSGTRGSNSKGFDLIIRDAGAKQRFLASLNTHLSSGLFDGVDLDWEWPGSSWESEHFGAFVHDLGKDLDKKGLGLSLAVSPWQKLPQETFDYLSGLHLMLYDNPEKHSTLEDMKKGISTFLKANDVPISLLYAGIPYYARGVTSQGRSWWEAVSYIELVRRYGYAPQSESFDGFYLNTRTTIAKKLDYIIDAHMGGMVIWHIGMDIAGSNSLTRFARQRFRAAGIETPQLAIQKIPYIDDQVFIGLGQEKQEPLPSRETAIHGELSKFAVLSPGLIRRYKKKNGPVLGTKPVPRMDLRLEAQSA